MLIGAMTRNCLWFLLPFSASCGGIAVFDSETETSTSTTTPTGTVTSVEDCPGYPNEYADYADNLCGQGNMMQCSTRPAHCEGEPEQKVCACDGVAYDSACEAAILGTDLSVQQICTAPPGTYPCGQFFCNTSAEYCEVHQTGQSSPDVYACNPIPPGCLANPSCDCLESLPCGGDCQEATPGRFLLICSE